MRIGPNVLKLLLISVTIGCAEPETTGPSALRAAQVLERTERVTDGRAFWRARSDSVLWEAMGTSRMAHVGLRAPGTARGVERGRIRIENGARDLAESAVVMRSGVTLLDRDWTLPILRIRIRNIETLGQLRRLPQVDYVEPDALLGSPEGILQDACGGGAYGGTTAALSPGDTFSPRFRTHGIDSAWVLGASGAGITIGLLDSGIDLGQMQFGGEFDDGMSAGRTVQSTHTFGTDAADDCGHGTHMAGILAAPRDGKNVVGIAWGANLYSVKIDNGPVADLYGSVDAILDGIDVVGPTARIIVLGFGTIAAYYASIEDKIDYWYFGYDRMFVAPGGNGFPWWDIKFPAILETVVAATGTTSTCDACVYGPAIDFTAYTGNPTTGAISLSGGAPIETSSQSSGSTVVVAGIAALVWSKFPAWTRQEVLDRMAICSQYAGNRHETRGWGFTSARCAVAEFTAYISGPVDVNSSQGCTLRYEAVGAGGVQPLSYSWTTTGTIVTESSDGVIFASFNTPGGHSLEVLVTDGNGAQASALLELTSSASGMDCVNY